MIRLHVSISAQGLERIDPSPNLYDPLPIQIAKNETTDLIC